MLKTLPIATLSLVVVLITAAHAVAAATAPPSNVPEPSTLVLMAGGIAGAILYARSRQSRK
jgi:hypothetical protein